MKHEEIAFKINAFVDNELQETLRTEIEKHLETCVECREEAQKLRVQAVYLKKNTEITPAPSFRDGINAAIGAQKPVKKGWINVGKLIPIPLALSLLVMIFSIYMATAPVIYGMNNGSVKTSAADMAKNAVMSCLGGGVFAPAAFVKFCGACTENACACCGAKCGTDCKMKTGGNEHGNEK